MNRHPVLFYSIVLVSFMVISLAPPVRAAMTFEISHADCRYLARHQPASDVEYRPGVDVHGKAVAPADLPGSGGLQLRQGLTIDIELDLRQHLGLAENSPLLREDANIGVVEVRDGEVYFNGQRLDAPEVGALEAVCEDEIEEAE